MTVLDATADLMGTSAGLGGSSSGSPADAQDPLPFRSGSGSDSWQQGSASHYQSAQQELQQQVQESLVRAANKVTLKVRLAP